MTPSDYDRGYEAGYEMGRRDAHAEQGDAYVAVLSSFVTDRRRPIVTIREAFLACGFLFLGWSLFH